MNIKQDFVLPVNGSDYWFRRSFETTKGKLIYSVTDSNNPSHGIFLFEQEKNGKWVSHGTEHSILETELLRRIIINEISGITWGN